MSFTCQCRFEVGETGFSVSGQLLAVCGFRDLKEGDLKIRVFSLQGYFLLWEDWIWSVGCPVCREFFVTLMYFVKYWQLNLQKPHSVEV